ncbi:nuclear transport factor 2 family protein [Planosporangium flavigriseum]|uniref:YybH family protein n=1 Tax=Planosporangium flavigriseum TaxID=373681 RepID=UPI00143A7565|nr:nuclear transport factor 2 family protein [Planosporangium flavigriseum]NJC66406.1 nuclear transport factor 2 family protein [Planosporangium flavigriseum]
MANADVLTQINRDIWIPFSTAYAAGDPEAFIALHSPEVIRVEGNGGWIGGFEEYSGRLREWFQWVAVQEGQLEIQFRFLERHTGDDASSERGVYRLTLTYPDTDENVWYGMFHTICRKRNGVWRIALDYDSDEGGTVGEETFTSGREMEQFETSGSLL